MSVIHSLILAAGKGTRMKSELPKVIHPILGKPMVAYVIEAAEQTGCSTTTIVTGYKSELVVGALKGYKVDFVEQPEQLGTGHAVQCYAEKAEKRPEHLLVICGDTPLISVATLKDIVKTHLEQKPAITMMTLMMQQPGNYGRIIRNAGKISCIREAKDCSDKELEVKEVNLAVYMFEADFLFDNIFKLQNSNKQGEFYLTDLVEMAVEQGKKVVSCIEKDEASTLGINSRQHLAQVSTILQQQILEKLMDSGVTIADPAQTSIGPDVTIGPDSTILPGCYIMGKTAIGSNCQIGPHCCIENSHVPDNAIIKPFSNLREQ